MHDYPPLVSGALHLLFRHFSQRQEVLMAFKQVGLVLFVSPDLKLTLLLITPQPCAFYLLSGAAAGDQSGCGQLQADQVRS